MVTANGPRPEKLTLRHPILATVGVLCVLLGALGIFIPGMPGTVFLLVASWCFAKSFPSLERRLLRNKFFAPYMKFVDGAEPLPRKDRIVAITLMWVSSIFSTWVLWYYDWMAAWFLPLVPLAACLGTIVILRRGRHAVPPSPNPSALGERTAATAAEGASGCGR